MSNRPKQWHLSEASLQIRAEGDALPAGVAGRVSGIALTYEVVDSYYTMFARGCAKRSIDTRVAARKVPLLMDHNRSVKSHVGVVAQMTEVGDQLMMVADILDTEEGREALEYVKAVIAADSSTGFSIGFVPRRSELVKDKDNLIERFVEIELREVSITPFPAVPGADITAARNDANTVAPQRTDADILSVAARVALESLSEDARLEILKQYLTTPALAAQTPSPSAPEDTAPAPQTPTRQASMDERIRAVRASYTHSQRA